MFDASEYAWKDLEIVVLGRPLIRILNVKYTTSQELKEIYGRGQEPLGIQEGNYSYEGGLTLGQSELEALVKKAKELNLSSVLKLKFDVNVAYSLDGTIVRDVCRNGRISKFEKAMKQGDTAMEVELPFRFTKVDYDV